MRFFTVYGPYGRPDMALYVFSSLIKKNKPINLFNNGIHYRDFTYIDDVTNAIKLLMKKPPKNKQYQIDKLSNHQKPVETLKLQDDRFILVFKAFESSPRNR